MSAKNQKPEDECQWCGDYRHQHSERGCRVCNMSSQPWDCGIYRCRGFTERGQQSKNEAEMLR